MRLTTVVAASGTVPFHGWGADRLEIRLAVFAMVSSKRLSETVQLDRAKRGIGAVYRKRSPVYIP
jgi:hypothetical protein